MITAISALSEQHKSDDTSARHLVRHRAISSFSQTVPSNAKLVRELAAQSLVWKPKSRQFSLLRVASCSDLANGSSHFLAPAFRWFSPTEPQATKAFVELIASGDRQTRLSRSQALWEAVLRTQYLEDGLRIPDAKSAPFDFPPSIVAEHSTDDRKRIDIFLRGSMNGEPVELVIEAKLGHHLTSQQLSNYTKDPSDIDGARKFLLVLAPRLTKGDAQRILKENGQRKSQARWRFATWRQFLIDFSSALAPEHDDDEFRRLRRSLADHAKKWE